MSEIRLRIRWQGGNAMLSLPTTSTMSSLRQEISTKTSIKPAYQELRKGYPPTVFTCPNPSLLIDSGIVSGETITVEKLSNPILSQQDSTSLKLVRRIIAADNSCLFNSIAYALETKNKKSGYFLRNVVSAYIESDPDTYNETLLGKSNQEYVTWIEQENSWGGGIELSILSKYYQTMIGAVSIQTARVDIFGQEEGYMKIIYVIYDGIHYDVLAKTSGDDEPESEDMTTFDAGDVDTYHQALAIASELKQAHQFTDVGNFTLRCGICYIGLVGEKGAIQHAQDTGHQNFVEYKR